MSKYDIHSSIMRALVNGDEDDLTVLLWMVILHVHDLLLHASVQLEDVVSEDATKPICLPAITRRHAANVMASLWPSNSQRGKEDYWYSLFLKETPFEVISDVPAEHSDRILAMKELMLCDPRIAAIREG